jgi:hypothetical protein
MQVVFKDIFFVTKDVLNILNAGADRFDELSFQADKSVAFNKIGVEFDVCEIMVWECGFEGVDEVLGLGVVFMFEKDFDLEEERLDGLRWDLFEKVEGVIGGLEIRLGEVFLSSGDVLVSGEGGEVIGAGDGK